MNSETADFLKAFKEGLEKGFESGFKKGKEYEHRWWSEHCASCTDADRPQGEWIEQEDDYHHYWECSECGMGVGLDDIRNYCPNCGAKMKGADDE